MISDRLCCRYDWQLRGMSYHADPGDSGSYHQCSSGVSFFGGVVEVCFSCLFVILFYNSGIQLSIN